MDISEYRKSRFWDKVWKSEDCWLWAGAVKKQGSYGNFAIGEGKTVGAHVYSWCIHNGPVPNSLYVCHTCDVPSCVNPDHLFLGTNQENLEDCVAKGRHVSGTQRLADEDLVEIKRLVSLNIDKHSIARRFGITVRYVNTILARSGGA